MQSEMICPFCQARRPVTSRGDLFPISFTVSPPAPPAAGKWYGDFDCYECPCGAVATYGVRPPTIRGRDSGRVLPPSVEMWEAGMASQEVILCEVHLQAPLSACLIEVSSVTLRGVSETLLWAKKRLPRSG